MSNTSHALERAREESKVFNKSEMAYWLKTASNVVREDIHMPEHITARNTGNGPRLGVECARCGGWALASSLSAVADFRDKHAHCGEEEAPAWCCPNCHTLEFAWQERCRHCNHEKDGELEYVDTIVVLAQQRVYLINMMDVYLASVRCGSLLRAKRAARAMYPWQDVTVKSDYGKWETGPSTPR